MPHVIGIDLGTTNSLVAFMDGERPRIIPNAAGARSTPSIVGLDRHDRLLIGAPAKNQLLAMPERTIAEVKRLMGSPEKVTLGARSYTPTEISGLILRALKQDAERFFGEPVAEAIVTVPAYFTDAQRQATKDAGELAGLKVERILNEPTAAALAYGIDNLDKEQYVLVYDLGGGTFDVSVLEMFNGVLDVKASAGNNRLGGGDFNRALAAFLREEVERQHGVDVRGNLTAMTRLKAAAEQAKIELSAAPSTQVVLPFLAVKAGAPISLELEVTRADLEKLIGPLVRSTLEPIESALADAKIDRRQIAEIVLVGGSSRLPLVQRLVAETFGKEARRGVDPDEAVALGAAIQAGLKTGAISAQTGIMITDVCPFTLGLEVMANAGSQKVGGMFSPIIPRNSTIPVSRTETYLTTADNQRQVEIRVFQGDSRMVKNNVFLDQYEVVGVPPGPAGSEKVAVTFTYDINGILKVTTKIVSTGKEATMVVDKSPRRMSNDELAKAKDRLDREWAPAPAAAAAASPGAAAPAAAASPYRATPAAPSAATTPKDGPLALVAAARAKLPSTTGNTAARLVELAARLERAVHDGDASAVARLDVELTDLLFELNDTVFLHDLKRAVLLHPDDAGARFALAEALFGDKQYEAAIKQLEKALVFDPDHANARRLLARAYRSDGRAVPAERTLEVAVRRSPDDPAARDDLAELLLEGRRIDDAILHLEEALRVDPDNVARRTRVADLALSRGLYARARTHLEHARRIAPTNADVLERLHALALELGDAGVAPASPIHRGREFLLYRTRATLGVSPFRAATATGTFREVAELLRRLDVAGARRALVTASADEQATDLFDLLRAEITLLDGDLAKAEKAFRRCVERGTNFALSYARLTEILRAAGRDKEAARFYEEWLEHAPDDFDGLEGYGEALLALGRRDEALRRWQEALIYRADPVLAARVAALKAAARPIDDTPVPGRIAVLGWNATGGAVSPVEAVAVAGRGELIFTGNVGKIGQDAAKVAFSCLKARRDTLGIMDEVITMDLHLHFVDTEMEKDGPSAGLALALAGLSALTLRPLRKNLAATGEITLQGAVRPIGGLHEKLLAAYLAGIEAVILPRRNLFEIRSLPDEVAGRVQLIYVDALAEALEHALLRRPRG